MLQTAVETITPQASHVEATVSMAWNGKSVSEAEQTEALKALQVLSNNQYQLLSFLLYVSFAPHKVQDSIAGLHIKCVVCKTACQLCKPRWGTVWPCSAHAGMEIDLLACGRLQALCLIHSTSKDAAGKAGLIEVAP